MRDPLTGGQDHNMQRRCHAAFLLKAKKTALDNAL